MRRIASVPLIVAALASCNAYDRTRYESLLDGATDIASSADGIDALPDAGDSPDVPLDVPVDVPSSDAPDVATCSVTPTLVPTCASIPALPHAPVIDGVPECEIVMQTLPIENFRSYMGAQPTDFTAEYGFAWRPNGIYVAFRVHRVGLFPAFSMDEFYCGDAMEVFVDSDGMYTSPPNYDDPGTRQFMIPAPANVRDAVTTGAVYVDRMVLATWNSPNVRAIGTADGYSGEVFVEAADLGLASWDLAANGTIGFDLAVDVGRPTSTGSMCVRYAGQFVMHYGMAADGGTSHPSADVRAFCLSSLAGP